MREQMRHSLCVCVVSLWPSKKKQSESNWICVCVCVCVSEVQSSRLGDSMNNIITTKLYSSSNTRTDSRYSTVKRVGNAEPLTRQMLLLHLRCMMKLYIYRICERWTHSINITQIYTLLYRRFLLYTDVKERGHTDPVETAEKKKG